MADHWQSDRPTAHGSNEGRKSAAWCLGCLERFYRQAGSDESCSSCPPGTPCTTNADKVRFKRLQAST